MTHLRLSSVEAGVTTLGPGPCVCVWVQGCDIGCLGCMSSHTWRRSGGALADVADVAAWVAGTGLSHLTISGGEPTDQSAALCVLVDRLRSQRPWTVTCYSGRHREQLERDDPSSSAELLDRLDLLIDGPYVAGEHAALRWRGSANQRLHVLSEHVTLPDDAPAGLEMVAHDDGSFDLIGVPSAPELVPALRTRLADSGTPVMPEPSIRFPFRVITESR